jgi:two-component system chemotaxis response regulator CheB
VEKRNIVVVGASAGGLEAIRRLIAGFSRELGVTMLIVWHMPPDVTGVLPRIINKEFGHIASNAIDGETVEAGHIYVAPPDHHLLIDDGRLRVTKGPKENRFRPAIDPLFRSAALVYGKRVIGVILSGALDDGSAGLWAVKICGGVAMVQDPGEAEVPGMPENAISAVNVDYKLKVGEMGAVIEKLSKTLVTEEIFPHGEETSRLSQEVEIAKGNKEFTDDMFRGGRLSRLTCPDCHGVLNSFAEGDRLRFRCHTGHAFSAGILVGSISAEIEEYLWNAVRASHEATMLHNNLGDHYAENNNPKLAAMHFNKARETERRLSLILTALHFEETIPLNPGAEPAEAQK